MTALLEIKNLNFSYGKNKIIDNLNLKVNENDFLAILGPNGAGKTTLFKLILGLIKADEGDILVNGKNANEQLNLIGYVPQYSTCEKDFPISVFEAVLTGRLKRKFHKYTDEDKKMAIESLRKMDILDLKERQIGELSGGQMQRMLVARAICKKPKLLLLDEPMANVDNTTEKKFYEYLKELNKEMAIVLITHDVGLMASQIKQVACLNKKIYYHGSIKEMKQSDIDKAYGCPVELIAHGNISHRVLKKHSQ